MKRDLVLREFVNVLDPIRDLGADALRWFHVTVVTTLLAAMFSLLAAWVLSFPGGLAGVFGWLLAQLCIQAGRCNVAQSLPGLGVALIILAFVFIQLVWMVFNDQDENREEILDMLEDIRERLEAASPKAEEGEAK